jgi:hypothetical protein
METLFAQAASNPVTSTNLIPIVLFGSMFSFLGLASIMWMIVECTRIRHTYLLKREMIQMGMNPEDIERILKAEDLKPGQKGKVNAKRPVKEPLPQGVNW